MNARPVQLELDLMKEEEDIQIDALPQSDKPTGEFARLGHPIQKLANGRFRGVCQWCPDPPYATDSEDVKNALDSLRRHCMSEHADRPEMRQLQHRPRWHNIGDFRCLEARVYPPRHNHKVYFSFCNAKVHDPQSPVGKPCDAYFQAPTKAGAEAKLVDHFKKEHPEELQKRREAAAAGKVLKSPSIIAVPEMYDTYLAMPQPVQDENGTWGMDCPWCHDPPFPIRNRESPANVKRAFSTHCRQAHVEKVVEGIRWIEQGFPPSWITRPEKPPEPPPMKPHRKRRPKPAEPPPEPKPAEPPPEPKPDSPPPPPGTLDEKTNFFFHVAPILNQIQLPLPEGYGGPIHCPHCGEELEYIARHGSLVGCPHCHFDMWPQLMKCILAFFGYLKSKPPPTPGAA
jgi:hypothetical protein